MGQINKDVKGMWEEKESKEMYKGNKGNIELGEECRCGFLDSR
jgi:hypothetical protein